MTIEILFVLIIVLLAIILFATEKITVDLTAIIIMGILLLSGIITPEEGISGFSNPATITVGAMFIVSSALRQTGAVNYIGLISSRIFRYNFWIGFVGTMVTVGVVSAFINNTPVVAVFIPIILSVAMDNKLSPSKLLMPVSFASMFGGVCTLVGTSTNILVSAIAVQHGLEPFSMFQFSSVGIVFFVTGILYMTLIGIRLLPERTQGGELTEKYKTNNYLTDIILLPNAKSVGRRLSASPLIEELDIDILEVIRNKQRLLRPLSQIDLQANDVLRVRCDVRQLQKLKNRMGIQFKSDLKLHDADFKSDDLVLVEAIIAPNSTLVGKTIKSTNFRNVFQANAVALRHRGQLYNTAFSNTPLDAGDAILIEVREENYAMLKNDPNFVVVSDVEWPKFKKRKIIPAFLITLGIILTATLNIFPIMVSATIGCVLLIVTRCISLQEAYKAIEWNIIFLLGGILALGIALEKTGAAHLLSGVIIESLGALGPQAVLAAFYLLTSILTSFMTNNATAVLLAPIAIVTANTLNVSPIPFLMTVAFAASASFMTPVGYQTNTMIYGVGQYKFIDFFRIGAPLNFIFWILAILFIPVFFPF